jgi:hypothetical protein
LAGRRIDHSRNYATAFALTVCLVSAGVLWKEFVEAILPTRNHLRSAVANETPAATLLVTKMGKAPGEGVEDWCLHDLRRTPMTGMAKLN